MSEELDRREMIEAALDQAEEGTLEAPIEKEIEVNDDPIQAEKESDSTESNDRDEKGRFKAQDSEDSTDKDSVQEEELVAEASNVPDEEEEPMEDMNDNQSMSDVEAPIEGSGMTGAYEGQGQGRRKTKQQKRMVGGNDGRRKRADIVKRIMKEKGLKMIEASKYVKQHNLYTK